jgi:hypothetical protein
MERLKLTQEQLDRENREIEEFFVMLRCLTIGKEEMEEIGWPSSKPHILPRIGNLIVV